MINAGDYGDRNRDDKQCCEIVLVKEGKNNRDSSNGDG